MFTKILEKLDDLFVVKQTKFTGIRIFFNFMLVILLVLSIPLYFVYENHVYDGYLAEYTKASELIYEYAELHGEYPVGERVRLEKEKELQRFFIEMNSNFNRELYYIDMELLPEFKDFKYTYMIDTTYRFVYTSESIVYKMARWHYAR